MTKTVSRWFSPRLQRDISLARWGHYGQPVLLVKLAWGGKSLAVDFRPPGSGGETGPYYKEIVERTRAVLNDLKSHFPEIPYLNLSSSNP